MIRSWLFVPGDSDRKLTRSIESGADAVIVDWEDAVAGDRKATARSMLPSFLADCDTRNRPPIYVRINPIGSTDFELDLEALPADLIQGVVVPKLQGPGDVLTVSRRLDQIEAQPRHAAEALRIVGIATETAPAVLALTEFRAALPRLHGLLWGAEDLAADLGVFSNRDSGGRYRPVFHLARDLLLLAAGAANCTPIDAVYVNYRDTEGLTAECRKARAMGFAGKAAIHPDQIPVIHDCFKPTEEERQWASRIVAAMEGQAGVAGLDGQMIDAPHVKLAQKILRST
ncbi:HpcH/HpaI aldolase/citrate lyase family protein [Alcaligenes phenolicus]|uniref:CoA ester lyase n=1 Tax=Alcaligenes phenolicus TaxID=232846 RepID=A0AAW5VKA7_9BURK|nr:CoA ester lyase [Alcaligenes phenolicus]MCX5564280.1 CoA ester lyase [Alcaligenes phenolicus]